MMKQNNDIQFMQRAIELAHKAEVHGNLPIGAIITLDGKIVAEGSNAICVPEFNPSRHAEITALDNVPSDLWKRTRKMTCYTTLEPCVMCFGRLLLSGVGRVVFGAYDSEGGAGCLLNHLPKFYNKENTPLWEGPLMPAECDELYRRARLMFLKLH